MFERHELPIIFDWEGPWMAHHDMPTVVDWEGPWMAHHNMPTVVGNGIEGQEMFFGESVVRILQAGYPLSEKKAVIS